MKSVLMSIQPYWVFLIVAKTMGWNINKEKTVEVRKNYPKDENWDKIAKIYCSKDKNSFARIPKEYQPFMEQFLGKVIGKFVCDKIIDIDYGIEEGVYFDGEYQKGFETNGNGDNPTCLSFVELENYLTNNEGYGWHISNLVIYDKPKELSEFCIIDNSAIQSCKHREIVGQPEYKTAHNGWIKGSYICNAMDEPNWCTKCKTKPLTKPPQSWCYVESEVDTE